MEDLKRYYETELSSLHKTVAELEAAEMKIKVTQSPQINLLHSSPVAQKSLKLTDTLHSSPKDLRSESRTKPHLNQSELWMMQSENERLQSNCRELQTLVDRAERQVTSLMFVN